MLDRDGSLGAWSPADNARLQRLLAAALPPFGGQGASGSMAVRRAPGMSPLVLHVNPVGNGQADLRTRRVAALALVVDPASRLRIDPDLLAVALGLTPTEGRVAVLLAEGMTVPAVAAGDRVQGKHCPWAPAAHLQQAGYLAAGGVGAMGAVAGGFSRASALKPCLSPVKPLVSRRPPQISWQLFRHPLRSEGCIRQSPSYIPYPQPRT